MDGESSYESDISESWSLIDINVNEESLPVTVTPSESEKTPPTVLNDEKSRKKTDLELKDFTENCKTDFVPLNNLDSDSSFVNDGFVNCSNGDLDGVHSPSRKRGGDDGPNDSDDVESIEILDMDGNYRDSEIDRLSAVIDSNDSQTYQSDDEESLDENISNKSSNNNNTTVIKRKKKIYVNNSEGPVNNVNSEEVTGKRDSRTCLIEAKSNGDESNKESRPGSVRSVSKHYRNNVATTALSLSVGVIFAGVACIAIGHFWGAQNAAETAGELAETLKKLQVENAALQSRLLHLNRVLLNREATSRWVLQRISPGTCKDGAVPRGQVETSEPRETDLNGAALSEIRSSLSSIEWLSKLQNLVRNENKAVENAIDFNSFGKYIHDQLNFLRNKKEGGVKLLEDADRKISKVLQKIVTRLSTSQENIENLYQRLMTLRDKLNEKLSKILPDSPAEAEEGRPKFERRVPVTELDLQSMRWETSENPEGNLPENPFRDNPSSVVAYRFPQPEKYYQIEVRDLEHRVEEKPFSAVNSSEILGDNFNETSKKRDKKSERHEDGKSKHKKRKKKKKAQDENKGKKRKPALDMTVPNPNDKEKKRKHKMEAEHTRKPFTHFDDLTRSRGPKKYSGVKLDAKPKSKKAKKSKFRRSFLSKLKGNTREEKRHAPICPLHHNHHCFNSTGFWVFKWAGGREEFRRHQALGEWQFERARKREELRDEEGYSINWQFKRALGRESNRHGERWDDDKGRRMSGKEFFHDRFS